MPFWTAQEHSTLHELAAGAARGAFARSGEGCNVKASAFITPSPTGHTQARRATLTLAICRSARRNLGFTRAMSCESPS